MKKLLLILITLAVLNTESISTHLYGGQISVTFLSGTSYAVELHIYRDIAGIPVGQSAMVSSYGRANQALIDTWTLPLVSSSIQNPNLNSCPTFTQWELNIYRDTVSLSPTVYNNPAGYILSYQTCCRTPSSVNLSNPGSYGINTLTLIPPVVDAMSLPIINSTAVVSTPFTDAGFVNIPYSQNFGGIDPDGDSLVYRTYPLLNQGQMMPGTAQGAFSPYSDPVTQFPQVMYNPGYSATVPIIGNGTPGSDFEIDPLTGDVTFTTNTAGVYSYGLVCEEYRNGVLIAASYRDIITGVANTGTGTFPNAAPDILLPVNQNLASWNGDTLVFTGAPVCIELGITDPDSIADVELEISFSDYAPGDITILNQSGTIYGTDTFQTLICYQPDTFVNGVSQTTVFAFDPGCYNLRSNDLSFYFRFDGYSNAGAGGIIDVPVGQNDFNLFNLLSGNPNPGGTWIDIDQSGLLQSNGDFASSQVSSTGVYRFNYIDEQPNFLADTSYLELNYVMPNALQSQTNAEDVKVYPNPSTGEVNIDVPAELMNREFVLVDASGQIIQIGRILSKYEQINIEEKGFYLLKIQNDKARKILIE